MRYPIGSWVKFKDMGVTYRGRVTACDGGWYTLKVPGDKDTIWQFVESCLEPDIPPATDAVNHPSHYTWGPVEVIEITERLNFCLGNVIKYVLRADHKGKPIEDLEKARFYLNREIENRKAGKPWTG